MRGFLKSLPALILIMAAGSFLPIGSLFAEEEDPRFQVVDVRGKVKAYGDRVDETYRLRVGNKIDDGDRLTTGKKAEVVLRLKGKGYVHLAPNSQIRISRLDLSDNKVRCQINLISGRVLVQLDKPSAMIFLVSAGELICRAHGTLFEAVRKKDDLFVVSYKGAMVVTGRSQVEMAKAGEVMKFSGNKFRFIRHHLEADEKAHREEWDWHLSNLWGPKKGPKGSKERP